MIRLALFCVLLVMLALLSPSTTLFAILAVISFAFLLASYFR